ncbi:hypothetical protein N7450_007873 [Penicillium hetheringtonii]|uniref:Fungal N-terminal domain-containing protein n=1 Tax=Penicillium hetheringtonii TaxID=911720 RepID=A0AAD6GQS9_9EURO|nr:hypothetical protein N7450_007873 [Penicillium hetheringtonii]
MDPVSIATAAAGLSGTCITVARAIYHYVEDVKNVDKGLILFGQELGTLSRSLDNVQDALRKHAHFLSNNLGDSVNLFNSLSVCIQDCDATIKYICNLLTEGQTHGRIGQTMGRVATHWKLKDKERELSLLRSRIISFHTTMDMNLKMIHMCLFLGAQEGNVKKQDSVLSELNQLRREIEQLTIMSDNRGVHDAKSVPATDNRGPSNTNNPKVVLGRGIPHGANSIKVQQPQSALGGNPLATKPAEPMFSTVETQHMQDIQLARSLLEGDHTERAKSLCRKVIHATDSNVGNMHRSHKNALQTLAHIYERTGDHEDAAQIRLLLDIQGHNTIRQEFKAMVQKQEFQKGIDYAYRWAILLQDNAALHAYSPYLEGLRMDRKYSSSVLFTAVCIMGNTLLAQTLLSQGASIHGQIYATLYGKRSALSPFGCAIHFGHCHLVRDLLEAASESLDSFIISNHFDLAINVWNPENLSRASEPYALSPQEQHDETI